MKDGKKKLKKNLKDNMWKTIVNFIKSILFFGFIGICIVGWTGCLFEHFSINSVEDYLILMLGIGTGFLITSLWISISKKY